MKTIIIIMVMTISLTACINTTSPSERELKIEDEFPNKIVYSNENNEEDMINDCNKRGGDFNPCGRSCPENSEPCITLCAPVCELYKDQENKGNTKDVILDNPKPNSTLASPVILEGKAPGTWYFEGIFKVKLYNNQVKVISETQLQALEDWQTEELVPFSGKLEFETDAEQGTLVFIKANPSGLPENHENNEFLVFFE